MTESPLPNMTINQIPLIPSDDRRQFLPKKGNNLRGSHDGYTIAAYV